MTTKDNIISLISKKNKKGREKKILSCDLLKKEGKEKNSKEEIRLLRKLSSN